MVFSMCFPKAGGSNLTRETSEERRKNAEIDKLLRKDKKMQAKQVKILLLGTLLDPPFGLRLTDQALGSRGNPRY